MPSIDDTPSSPPVDPSLAHAGQILEASSCASPPSLEEAPAEDKDTDGTKDEDKNGDGDRNGDNTGHAEEGEGDGSDSEDEGENEDEDEAPMVAEEGSPAGDGSLEDAQRLFDEGREALHGTSQDFDKAAELLSRCLEIRAAHYGELAIECASTYYKYGCALLYKSQSESDPLEEVKENIEPSTAAGRPGELIKDEAAEEDLGEEADDDSDLDMAWKMLDIARVIYEKQNSHSIEEVDVITALADVSLEREDFDMCFQDYMKALEIMEGLVEPDHRGIAELCFKLSLAHQLGYKPREALRYCQQAVMICEARLKRLKNEAAISNETIDVKGKSIIGDDAAKENQKSLEAEETDKAVTEAGSQLSKEEGEIKEIEQLLEDLREKVVELEGMASGPSLLDSLKETNPGAINSIKHVFSATAQLASLPGQISSSQTVTVNGAFAAPSGSASSNVGVTDLGIVGRGVKRAVPTCVSDIKNGQVSEENAPKKRSLDDMLTKEASSETQIGFGLDDYNNASN